MNKKTVTKKPRYVEDPLRRALRLRLGVANLLDEKRLLVDGHEDAFVGVVSRFGIEGPITCYDKQLILLRHMADGMTYEDAEEFFTFNQVGAWAGDKTPCFLERI